MSVDAAGRFLFAEQQRRTNTETPLQWRPSQWEADRQRWRPRVASLRSRSRGLRDHDGLDEV